MFSLRQKITRAFLAIGLPLLMLFAVSDYVRTRTALYEQFDADLRARSEALVSLLQWRHDGSLELDYHGEYMPEYEHRPGSYFFQVWRGDTDSVLERANSLKPDNLSQLRSRRAGEGFVDGELSNGTPVRAYLVDVPAPDHTIEGDKSKVVNSASVAVAGSTAALNTQLRRGALQIGAGGLLGLLLITWALHITLASELAPLTRASELAANWRFPDLHIRFNESGLPSEIQPIFQRMNALLERLESSMLRERQFSADVAHELRTPIAELLSLAQVCEHGKMTEQDRGRFFADVEHIAEQMRRTVTTLLELARSENSSAVAIESVALKPLLDSLCSGYRQLASKRNVRLLQNVDSNTQMRTDPAVVTRLLQLLSDNAVMYTQAKGCVEFSLSGDGALELRNGPTDLVVADLPHLCERFWRKDAARTSASHSGLGLSLAQQLAGALGLDIDFRLDQKTLVVTLLPLKGTGQIKPV